MDVKMSSDMPLPTHFSVIRSPSHMMIAVPAVIVMMMISTVSQVSLVMIGRGQSPSRAPDRAS